MIDSNFYTLLHVRLKPSEREKRLQWLNDAVSQLREYKIKARHAKLARIERLICAYDNLIQKIGE